MTQLPFFYLDRSVEKQAAGLGSLRNPLIGAGLGAGAGGLVHALRRSQMDEEEKERAGSGNGALLASMLGGGAIGAGGGALANLLGKGDGINKGDYSQASPDMPIGRATGPSASYEHAFADMPTGLKGPLQPSGPDRPEVFQNALRDMTSVDDEAQMGYLDRLMGRQENERLDNVFAARAAEEAAQQARLAAETEQQIRNADYDNDLEASMSDVLVPTNSEGNVEPTRMLRPMMSSVRDPNNPRDRIRPNTPAPYFDAGGRPASPRDTDITPGSPSGPSLSDLLPGMTPPVGDGGQLDPQRNDALLQLLRAGGLGGQ